MPYPISPDGRWWWDGSQWRSRVVEGELELFWFTQTPDWAGRVLLTGLICLIPIAGSINLYGWTLGAADMVRHNWRELPQAGFAHLERGVAPFVVAFVYGLVVLFVFFVMGGGALWLGLADRPLLPLAIGLGGLTFLLLVAYWVLSLYCFGALLAGADRLGIGPCLNPLRLWRIARANHAASLRFGLTYLVAAIVFGLVAGMAGAVIPFGGLVVSVGLPAVFALVVPALARFEVEPARAARA